jgi:hypothetical protein
MPSCRIFQIRRQSRWANGTDGLSVAKTWHEAAIDEGEDAALRLHSGVGGLVQRTAHLTVALGRPVAVVDAGTLVMARARADPGREMAVRWKRRGGHPDFRDDLLRRLDAKCGGPQSKTSSLILGREVFSRDRSRRIRRLTAKCPSAVR